MSGMFDDSANLDKADATLLGRRFSINSDRDLVTIREFGRTLGAQIGFSSNDRTLIATALSEICRNVLEYAGSGDAWIEPVTDKKGKKGISIVINDYGPGIEDIKKALREGYSTGRGMGIGLPGAKRIMDEFDIDSKIGTGTRITMRKWLDNYGI